jgi:hypothetical protein
VWRATAPGRGPGVQKTPWRWGEKTVPGPSPGGVGGLAAASAGEGADGVVGAAGTVRRVGGGSTGGQRKVTALGGPGGRPRQRGTAGGLRQLVEMVSVLSPTWMRNQSRLRASTW